MVLTLFFTTMFAEFFAEMGDKTQFMLVAMTSRYKIKHIVLGTAAAIAVLNGIAVFAGSLAGEAVPAWLIKLVAAAAFLYFAASSLAADDGGEESRKHSRFDFAPLAVFCTFFVAELGDKTQLTAITFGANYGLHRAALVWLACSLGLFLADMLGMALVYAFKGRISDGALKIAAFAIFTVFGFRTLAEGAFRLARRGTDLADGTPGFFAMLAGSRAVLIAMCAVAAVFAAVCAVIVWRGRTRELAKRAGK